LSSTPPPSHNSLLRLPTPIPPTNPSQPPPVAESLPTADPATRRHLLFLQSPTRRPPLTLSSQSRRQPTLLSPAPKSNPPTSHSNHFPVTTTSSRPPPSISTTTRRRRLPPARRHKSPQPPASILPLQSHTQSPPLSPGGQHFLSCKEVSEYMQSVLGSHSAPQQGKDSTNDSIQLDNRVISPTNGHDNREVNDGRQSNKFEKDPLMSGMDNLAQKATRRFRLGSSVGDGVIVKDGKYECQFCHKVFHERRRYNGHVGVHVRNYVRGVEESPAERMALKKKTDSPVEDEVPARTSKMDALIEIAQNSILEASPGVPNDESNRGVASDKDDAIYVPVSVADSEVASGFHLPDVKMQDSIKEKTPELEIQKEGVNIIEEVENVAEGSEDVRINASLSAQLSPVSEFIKGKGNLAFNHDGKGKGFTTGSSVGTYGAEFLVNNKAQVQKELDMAVGSGGIEGVTVNTDVEQAVQQLVKENVVPHEGTGAAILMSELNSDLSAESTPFAMFDKEENEFDAGVDELRVEDMELVGLETEQETLMATEGPVHEGVRAEIESMCNVSGPLDSEFGSGTVQGSEELPTMCTWCGMEFGYASSGASAQSGSAGYMCHSCRLKVSMEVD
ncbi:hypothetical protein LINPERHAP2_LOCUS12672, partial [Linum perenne]